MNTTTHALYKTSKHIGLFLFCLAGPVAPLQAQLTNPETMIAKYVDDHQAEALQMLEKTVNINSGSMNFEGVRQVGQIFKAELDLLGFKTRWVDGEPFGRAGHLVGTHRGKGKTILLIGHLDTVFEPSSPFQQFETINDSTVRGPGVGDMKGGDVVIIQSLQALKAAQLLKKMNIIVVMTGDEEMSGRPLNLARKDLIEAAEKADIAIGFEDGDGNPATAVVARRSSSGWTLRVKGTPAHSSQLFQKEIGAGAIYEMARILDGFYTTLSEKKNLTFNPGVLLAGTLVDYDKEKKGGTAYGKSNVVAQDAIVTGDIRTLSKDQLAYAQATMKKVVAQHLPQTEANIEFKEGYPPLAPTAGNYKLLSYLDKVSQDLGLGPVTAVDPANAGAADISFVATRVDMAIDGLGMGSQHGHTVQETADPRTLATQAKRAAILLYRLSYDQFE